ncbi:hypothetical protein LWI29_003768 [Acer saccharum]|uniref:Uncharacterized protein n=1 Tax=Acer saccharum TaxID=4024 RepID=A0AA39VAZ3_ACESA|nr:hypothetical protein LWI29_003768 [Acer saccharum]
MLNIEEVVDRVGFQLSEILQEVEEEKEEPPRLSQPTYPLCSHEEESGLGASFNDNGDGNSDEDEDDGDENDNDLAFPSSLCVTLFLGLQFAHRPKQQRLTSFFLGFQRRAERQ